MAQTTVHRRLGLSGAKRVVVVAGSTVSLY